MWPALALMAMAALIGGLAWARRRLARLGEELGRQQRENLRLQVEQTQAMTRETGRQEALFHSMTEGVLVLDAQGRVQLVNQACRRLFNLPADVRGQTVMEAFRQHELLELTDRTLAEGRVLGAELTLARPENRSLQVNSSVFLDAQQRSQGTILVFHDVTRLRQLENTRREFVANVSHELRTPLSMIKGFVETLIDGAKDDPALCPRFLKTIEKHTDRLTYLIEDLLTISRLESGELVMNPLRVDAREVAQKVKDDLRPLADEKAVKVDNRVPEGTWVRADPDRLQQVLLNLTENALKYGRRQGEVVLAAQPAPEGQVRLWVADDGPGIPPEAQSRVFERFYRVDRARSRETGGTGLGLAIVKHIVQSHGGQVWLESVPGEGATFYFTLPAG